MKTTRNAAFFLCAILFVFFANIICAQPWPLVAPEATNSFLFTYQGGTGTKSIMNNNGTVYIAGEKNGKVYLQLNNLNGVSLWTRLYSINGIVNDMKKDSVGNIIIICTTGDVAPLVGITCAMLAIKVNYEGNILGQPKIMSSDGTGGNGLTYGNAVVITPNGYIFFSETGGFACADKAIWAVETDFDLNINWSYIYGNWTSVKSAKQTSDGKYVIFGDYVNSQTGSDLCFLKIDILGNQQWFRYYGGNNSEIGYDFIEASNSNLVGIGRTTSNNALGGLDGFLIEANSFNGDTVLTRNIGSENRELMKSISETNAGYILAGGSADLTQGGTAGCLLKIATDDASVIWSKIIGPMYTNSLSTINSVVPTASGGLYLTGITNNLFFIGKTDSAGGANCFVNNANMISYAVPTTVGSAILARTSVVPVIVNPIITMTSTTVLATDMCLATEIAVVATKEFSIHPNPCINHFIVENAEGTVFKVYNLTGELVFQKKINNILEKINFNFPAGIYFYNIGNKSGKIIVDK